MDLYNNAVGRTIGATTDDPTSLADGIAAAVAASDLLWLSP